MLLKLLWNVQGNFIIIITRNTKTRITTTWHFGYGKSLGEISSSYFIAAPEALGIGAASFASGASKDIAESPTAELKAEPERPRKRHQDTKSPRLRVETSHMWRPCEQFLTEINLPISEKIAIFVLVFH